MSTTAPEHELDTVHRRRHPGGRPRHRRYKATVILEVDLGAPNEAEAERRLEALVEASLSSVNPNRPGRPRIAYVHAGRVVAVEDGLPR